MVYIAWILSHSALDISIINIYWSFTYDLDRTLRADLTFLIWQLRDESKELEIREQEAKRFELHKALKQRKIIMGPFLSPASQHRYVR